MILNLSCVFYLAAGIVIEENNWPPFFPVIHHDIANEIPIHLQRLQYVAFTTYLGMSSKSSFIDIVVFFLPNLCPSSSIYQHMKHMLLTDDSGKTILCFNFSEIDMHLIFNACHPCNSFLYPFACISILKVNLLGNIMIVFSC